MTIDVKIGRTDSLVSSFNLVFDNGLRLSTPNLIWVGTEAREAIRTQFAEVIAALRAAGHTVNGSVTDVPDWK